MKGTHNYLY